MTGFDAREAPTLVVVWRGKEPAGLTLPPPGSADDGPASGIAVPSCIFSSSRLSRWRFLPEHRVRHTTDTTRVHPRLRVQKGLPSAVRYKLPRFGESEVLHGSRVVRGQRLEPLRCSGSTVTGKEGRCPMFFSLGLGLKYTIQN